ncbi:hypothetical protein NP1_57 [Xanthomonas phage NP1]|nr:hypothetical protein NP1_57 [Xanthomonas phage NP1]
MLHIDQKRFRLAEVQTLRGYYKGHPELPLQVLAKIGWRQQIVGEKLLGLLEIGQAIKADDHHIWVRIA